MLSYTIAPCPNFFYLTFFVESHHPRRLEWSCNPVPLILTQIPVTPIYGSLLLGILSSILEIRINDAAIDIISGASAAGRTPIRQIKQLCNLPSVKLRRADMMMVKISSRGRQPELKHPTPKKTTGTCWWCTGDSHFTSAPLTSWFAATSCSASSTGWLNLFAVVSVKLHERFPCRILAPFFLFTSFLNPTGWKATGNKYPVRGQEFTCTCSCQSAVLTSSRCVSDCVGAHEKRPVLNKKKKVPRWDHRVAGSAAARPRVVARGGLSAKPGAARAHSPVGRRCLETTGLADSERKRKSRRAAWVIRTKFICSRGATGISACLIIVSTDRNSK